MLVMYMILALGYLYFPAVKGKKSVKLKLQSVAFLVKNDLKSIFEQVHNQPVFKTMALL